MKKTAVYALSAVALAAVAYGSATWWAGKRTETLYAEQIALLQQRYPGITVLDHQYERGFWHSTSTVTLQYGRPDSTVDESQSPDTTEEQAAAPDSNDSDNPQADQEGEEEEQTADEQSDEGDDADTAEAAAPLFLTFVLSDRITHGPLTSLRSVGAASVDSTLTLDARSTPEIAATLAGQTLATATTDVDFSGDFSSRFEGPSLQWATPGGDTMNWQGFQGSLTSAGQAQTLNYELTAPGLQLDNPDDGMHLGFSGLSLRGIDKSMNALWALSGRDEGQIGQLSVRADETADDGQPFALALQNVQFQQTNKMSGDLLDGMLQVTGSGQAGELPINRFEVRTSLTRLHAPTYLRMAEKIAGLSSDDTEGAAAVMRNNLSALLAYNPEYALDTLTVEIDGQQGELSYKLGMPGITPQEQDVPLSLLAMSRLRLDATASVPTSWVEWMARESALDDGGTLTPAGARALIEELVRQGMAVRDGERLRSTVLFDKGRLEVNGKPLKGGLGALGNL